MYELYVVLYPIYFIISLFIALVIAINSKRIRANRFDALPLYMGLYLINVILILGVLKAGVPILVATTAIMLYVIVRTSKVQLIGITGSPGSGKTTIVDILHQDAKLAKIDLEVLMRKVVQTKKEVYDKLIKEFGDDIIDTDRKDISKKYLHEIIIPRDVLKKKFRQIMEFPLLIELLKELYELTKTSRNPIVLDAPLLFDFKYLPYMCYPNVALFLTEQALPVKRVAERDNISIGEASKQITMSQAQIGHILKRADMKINNDGDLLTLKHKFINELAPFLL